MTEKQKDSFIEHMRSFLDGQDAAQIKWLAFVMTTDNGRIALASENAPKSTKLCD